MLNIAAIFGKAFVSMHWLISTCSFKQCTVNICKTTNMLPQTWCKLRLWLSLLGFLSWMSWTCDFAVACFMAIITHLYCSWTCAEKDIDISWYKCIKRFFLWVSQSFTCPYYIILHHKSNIDLFWDMVRVWAFTSKPVVFLLSQRTSTNCTLAFFGTRPTVNTPLSEFACIAPWQQKSVKGGNGREEIHILRWVLENSTKDFRYYSKMIWLPKITCIWPYESCKGSGQINIRWLNGESRQTCPKMKNVWKKVQSCCPERRTSFS